MQAKLPVLACTDPNTDIGKVIVDGGFGWWCESNDTDAFGRAIEESCESDLAAPSEKVWKCLNREYSADKEYQIVIEKTGK